jgi:hypothetical protein
MVRGARRVPQDVPIATGSFSKRLQVSIIIPLSDLGNSGRRLTNLRGRSQHHRAAHQDHRQTENLKEKQNTCPPATASTPGSRLVATGNP